MTALGLKLGYDLCRENLEDVVAHAAQRGNFVRIDMEDSSTTDDTLRLYRELRAAGHENVGIVLQSRLRRTVDDMRALAELRPNVRLCKGIYLEPPEVAFQGFDEVREAFVQALEEPLGRRLLRRRRDARRLAARPGSRRRRRARTGAGGVRAADAARRSARARGRARAEGHRLRIYTPFGSHWYGYSLRRLQENPKIAGYIASDTFHRLLPGRNGAA